MSSAQGPQVGMQAAANDASHRGYGTATRATPSQAAVMSSAQGPQVGMQATANDARRCRDGARLTFCPVQAAS